MASSYKEFNVAEGFTGSKPRFEPNALRKVLVANRGEIALRLIRTCRALNLATVSIYTTADEGSPHTLAADETVFLPGKEADGKGYLFRSAIIQACIERQVQAVLPGYGFLSENELFAKELENAGVILCGPRSETMEAFGLKHRARELADRAHVPCVPGTGLLQSPDDALKSAEVIGYPVMLKSSAGGGGMGLQVCWGAEQLRQAYESVTSRGKALFGSGAVFLEKYVEKSRHIEIQIFGNGQGDCVSFNERECSIQRRNQKVIEEAPSPFVANNSGLREKLNEAAISLGKLVKYRSAETIEMLVDDSTAKFYFLECNVRLQVEHPVTEISHDIDLVALMLMQAEKELNGQGGVSGAELAKLTSEPRGWAIEARLYAEDPIRNYAPSPGVLQLVDFSHEEGTRVDGWIKTGTLISPNFDPLLAKMIGSGLTREDACKSLKLLLSESKIKGPPTNLGLLQQILVAKSFEKGSTLTSFLSSDLFQFEPHAFEVISPGISTSVQAYPGRRGILHGIPEAGPLDSLSLRIANILVGNPESCEGLEMTITGPTLLFHTSALVSIVGAEMDVKIDGIQAPSWTRLPIRAGSRLSIASVKPGCAGARAYLAIYGGLPGVAEWTGSKATSPAIGVGGYQGRNLLTGDTLDIQSIDISDMQPLQIPENYRWTKDCKPGKWELFTIPGPFDDDEFLTAADRDKLYESSWRVSPQAARSGTRFDAPLLRWARQSGGEGGSHPSNVLEFGYTPLGINWNGNTPVLLGADGPDLGGLLISHTIISSDWRAGQLVPGDDVKFRPISFKQAKDLLEQQENYLTHIVKYVTSGRIEDLMSYTYNILDVTPVYPSSLLKIIPATSSRPRVEFRAGGDRALVICYGAMTANIINRARIELLQRSLEKKKDEVGITAFSPNARTLTIHFDPKKSSPDRLIEVASSIEATLPSAVDVKLPVKTWKFPVTMNDPKVAEAVARYKTSVRNKAIYLEGEGDNKPYLVRCNGLSSTKDIEAAITETTYVAVSVGFYFGTPILLPLDPRRRLKCQKYDPTRLWTPMGALGLGGSMAAIYGADSPGGYPLMARTIPGWRTYGDIPPFEPSRPWLLSDFDFVKFIPYDQEDYEKVLTSFLAGTYEFEVEETLFDVAAQAEFLEKVKDEAEEFEKNQSKALEECRQQEEKLFAAWKAEEDSKKHLLQKRGESCFDFENNPNAVVIRANLPGSVWKIAADEGQVIKEGHTVVILEAMKSEINVKCDENFKVMTILKNPGEQVLPGDPLVVGEKA